MPGSRLADRSRVLKMKGPALEGRQKLTLRQKLTVPVADFKEDGVCPAAGLTIPRRA
jgi:hypothetical protein